MIRKIFKPLGRLVNSIQSSLTTFIRALYLITIVLVAIVYSGCTGIITGHEYTKSDLVIVYKVVKSGVSTFMTREQIEEARLNKVDLYVTDTYKLVAPYELEDSQNIQSNLQIP